MTRDEFQAFRRSGVQAFASGAEGRTTNDERPEPYGRVGVWAYGRRSGGAERLHAHTLTRPHRPSVVRPSSSVLRRRAALALAATVLATVACGSGKPSTATVELEKGGSFKIRLFPDAAPKTVENFTKKAAAGYFDGLIFHRVEDWVVQGGDPNTRGKVGQDYALRPDPAKPGLKIAGTGGGTISTELNQRPFAVGAVGVARGQDVRISNDSQFFVCKRAADWLNGQYTNFGQVTDGIDVVAMIQIGDQIKRIRVR